jgi:allophanate hydrolase
MSLDSLSFAFESLRAAYRAGRCTPQDVLDEVLDRLARDREHLRNVWLHVLPERELHRAAELAMARERAGERLPLYGLPFAVKDNIDVGGVPTTAACPDFAYVPGASAPVVARLQAAGAIVVGKVNLDQFATGLVGTRSPFGVPTNPFDARMIPGGSSSGSAVAVAAGQVSFALGTDTAGSGRVPAAFNNVVGLKPSSGALSTRGVVPACRSLDCVSIFALTVPDACEVATVARQWDELDPFSRPDADAIDFEPMPEQRGWRLGIPRRDQLTFFGDDHARAAFDRAAACAREMSSSFVEVDWQPFRSAGELLYGGPWVTERLVATGDLLARSPEALLPVLREILAEARRFQAIDVFTASYRLRELRQSVEATWRTVDALLLPTAPTIYRVDEVLADPRALNANLGLYTTFLTWMDLAAIAVPAGFRDDRLPFGVTFVGPRRSDAILSSLGQSLHRALGSSMGATGHPLRSEPDRRATPLPEPRKSIVVVGAHLSGQPLNPQLTTLGGMLVRPGKTAPAYRLFALRGTVPPKPGLARVREGGRAIEVEIWSLDDRAFATFVGAVVRPLCIGSIELDDGTFASGFLCEPEALGEAIDISHHGGWRSYLRAISNDPGQEQAHPSGVPSKNISGAK